MPGNAGLVVVRVGSFFGGRFTPNSPRPAVYDWSLAVAGTNMSRAETHFTRLRLLKKAAKSGSPPSPGSLEQGGGAKEEGAASGCVRQFH